MTTNRELAGLESHRKKIREYYGEVLKSAADLKTNACCTSDALPARHRAILAEMPGEVLEKFYGCGSPIPEAVEGMTVLDLGCGSGRDAYLLSKLVGPAGQVIGVDMTPHPLEVARKHLSQQMRRWGFPRPNLEFRTGFIEDLRGAGLADASVDIVVSNCVINLSPDKPRVFEEIFRVLKPGGELFFSDVFSGRRIPEALRDDAMLQGECLGGALYHEDFRRLLRGLGILDHRVVSRRRIDLGDEVLREKIGRVDFYSMTLRAFKIPDLEDLCEDYGQVATYLGSVADHPHFFSLDDHHVFETGKPVLVCGNTAAMLSQSRLGKHFRLLGDRATHFGPFPCAPAADKSIDGGNSGACC